MFRSRYSLVTTLCVVTIFGRSASFPFLMLFLLSDNFGRRAAEERSHAEHGNEDIEKATSGSAYDRIPDILLRL